MSASNLRETMTGVGLRYDGDFIPDGKLHRISCSGDRERNSWYVLFSGDASTPSAAAFGCWKRNIRETWCDKSRNLSQSDMENIRRRLLEAERVRHRVEQERQAKAKEAAVQIVSESKPATDHAYLTRKGIKCGSEVLEHSGSLVLRLCDSFGVMHSLQFIRENGEKRFLFGGRVNGCFFELSGIAGESPLVICEGYATGQSIHDATGYTVACAMNCGNLLPTAKALRAKFPDREIIVAADNDAWTEGNPGLTKADEAAKSIQARLVSPQFKDISTKPTDFNDLVLLQGQAALKAQIETAAIPPETDSELYERLSQLSLSDYDRVREAEAKRVGIRVSTLDSEVAAVRPKKQALTSEPLVPWDTTVDGGDLLGEIAGTIRRFVVIPEVAINFLAIYILYTYLVEYFQFCPVVLVVSPEPECGKGRVLDICEKLCRNSFRTANTSPAVLYHSVEMAGGAITLLIDEIDSQSPEQVDAISNILKGGFEKNGRAHRMEKDGEKQVVKEFRTYSAKVCAGIGLQCFDKATASRAVVLEMRRKKKDEKTEKFRKYSGVDIQRKCLRWAEDNLDRVKQSVDVVFPDNLCTDRQEDVWEPLIQISELCGPKWLSKAWESCRFLTGKNQREVDNENTVLLSHCWSILCELDDDRISSEHLMETLRKLPETDYGMMNFGKGITQKQISGKLTEYGIKSKNVKIEGKPLKGYYKSDFKDAAERYLSDGLGVSTRYPATESAGVMDSPLLLSATTLNGSGSKNGTSPCKNGAGSGVADEKAECAGKGMVFVEEV